MIYEIIIPGWRPAALNALLGRHPARANRLKRGDRDLIKAYALMARVPGHRGRKRRVSLRITLGPGERETDIDAYHKSTLDACVWAGLLKNDTRAYAEWGGVVYTSRGHRSQTVVIVTDLGPGESSR